jgi:hypothetical protein
MHVMNDVPYIAFETQIACDQSKEKKNKKKKKKSKERKKQKK